MFFCSFFLMCNCSDLIWKWAYNISYLHAFCRIWNLIISFFSTLYTQLLNWSDHIILLTQAAASLLRKSLHYCFPKLLHTCYHSLLHPLSFSGIFSSRLNRIPIVGPNSTIHRSKQYHRVGSISTIVRPKSYQSYLQLSLIIFNHPQFTNYSNMHLPKTTNHSESGWSFPEFL